MKEKNFGADVPAGFLMYPVSQAADIASFGAHLVPVGEDQKPMIEQTNEIVRKFNRVYKPVLVEAEALIPKIARLPGTDGSAKMSKSLGNCIFLSDASSVISKKVRSMFTDPKHVRVADPGRVEGNPVFAYLDAFDPMQEDVKKLKTHYKKGGLGDIEVKKRLDDVLHNKLTPIRTRREEYAKDPGEVMRLLERGTEKARERAQEVLAKVRSAMMIDYF